MLAVVNPAQRVTTSPTKMHTYASSVRLATLPRAKENDLARVSVLCSLLQDVLQKYFFLPQDLTSRPVNICPMSIETISRFIF